MTIKKQMIYLAFSYIIFRATLFSLDLAMDSESMQKRQSDKYPKLAIIKPS